MYSFQETISILNKYWSDYGCQILQPYTSELGAATLHPATFFGAINAEGCNIAYPQPVIRPTDGRAGRVINRLYQHHQYQVLLKPSPKDLQKLYLDSLRAIGINIEKHDIRFVEDNWENPSIGAWGLGWEVWLDGMEITQFTYMQQVGGIDCSLIPGEIAYGLERIVMNIQGVETIFDIQYDKEGSKYSDVFARSESEFSCAAIDLYSADKLYNLFKIYKEYAKDLIVSNKVLVAYDFCVKSSHILNILDARGLLSVSERADNILLIRKLVKECASLYLKK